jgi:uncharacterized LabA/DUF88 family protein
MTAFYGCVPDIQYKALAAEFHAQRTYYDAINYGTRSGEADAQRDERIVRMQALHDHISSQPGFHVREGHVRRSPQRKKQEQKGVDVQLAVEALEHAARGNMQTAVLLTGDLDFEPLLMSLARMGVRTILLYVPQHAALELRQAADEIRKMTLQHFWSWSAPSFQSAYPQLRLFYGEAEPGPPIFEQCREGTWSRRKVILFRPTNNSPGRLYVQRGNELSEPSYMMEYPDAERLPLAFELTFGEVGWHQEPAEAKIV